MTVTRTPRLGLVRWDSDTDPWSREDLVENIDRLEEVAPVNPRAPHFGAIGDGVADDTAALQAAIDEARATGAELYLPAGTYRLTGGLVDASAGTTQGLRIRGDGRGKTILRADFDAAAVLRIEGAGTLYQFQHGGRISDLTIDQAAGRTGVIGLQLTGYWAARIERVTIVGVSSHGIYVPKRDDLDATNPDGYAVVLTTLEGCRIDGCAGWGIYGAAGLGFSGLHVASSYIVNNRNGGLYLAGHNTRITGTSIAYNGQDANGGITVDRIGTHPNGLIVEDVELDGNYRWHVNLVAAITWRIDGNRFIHQDGGGGTLRPPLAVQLGENVGNYNITKGSLSHNHARTPAIAAPYTFVKADSPSAVYNEVIDNNLSTVAVTGAITPYVWSSTTAKNNNRIVENNARLTPLKFGADTATIDVILERIGAAAARLTGALDVTGAITTGAAITGGGTVQASAGGAASAYLRAAASGTGLAGVLIDASDGDFAGSDYASLTQLDTLDLELNNRAAGKLLILRTSNATRITVADGTTTVHNELVTNGGIRAVDGTVELTGDLAVSGDVTVAGVSVATDDSVAAAVAAHVDDTTAAHAATAVSYAGAAGLSATDVEAALDELDTEKAPKAAPTFTGTLTTDGLTATGNVALGNAATDLIGFYGAAPVARPGAYNLTGSADRTLAAYASDSEAAAYTGAADGEAKLADLNALRVAYENLRTYVEDLAGVTIATATDLKALGLLG